MIEFTSSMVRLLKGAPLSCLMLLLLERQAVSAQYMERNTGYSDKLVHSALLLLEEKGLITRNARYSWQIADGIRQLPLMQMLAEPEDEPDSVCAQTIEDPADETVVDLGAVAAAETAVSVEKPVENMAGSRRNSDSENLRLPSSSRSLTRDLTNKDLPPPLDSRESEIFRVRSNFEACDAAGIREPARSRLARMLHVTPELIEYHAKNAPVIGAAIYRIEHNWTPKERDDQSEGRRKYVEGEYADFIEH